MIRIRDRLRAPVLIAFAVVALMIAVLSLVAGPALEASATASSQGRALESRQAGPEERLERLLARLEQRKAASSREPSTVQDWNPPAPAPVVVQPQPAPPPKPVEHKPEAPPLPFAYIGHMNANGKLEVFLGHGLDAVRAEAGDVLRDVYRVDQITDQAVSFTHLPTGLQQTLAIPPQ